MLRLLDRDLDILRGVITPPLTSMPHRLLDGQRQFDHALARHDQHVSAERGRTEGRRP